MKTVLKKPGNRPAGKRVRTPGIQSGETAVTIQGHPSPRLPNERDESASSQVDTPRPVIEQAKKDVEAGLKDADKGPAMDALYEREFRQPAGKDAPSSPPQKVLR